MITHIMPVVINNLSKIYFPKKVVLDQINLIVAEGETVGILGNNGSGKTTLLRSLATLYAPSYGSIEIFGMDTRYEGKEIKKVIGYLPERFNFYPYSSVNDIFDFFEKLNGLIQIDQEDLKEKIIGFLGLNDYLDFKIGNLSKGLLQKLGVAVTLLHDPPLLLLDEPTTGLDPLVRAELRKALNRLTDNFEKTILMSSHILEDVEVICDRVFFLENGKILHEPFWVKELKNQMMRLQKITVKENHIIDPHNLVDGVDGILYYDINGWNIEIFCKKENSTTIANELNQRLKYEQNLKFNSITLEDIYLLNHKHADWVNFLQ